MVGALPRITPNGTAALGDIDGLSRDAIEALPAAIYMTDAEGRLTFFNEAAAALWGCRPELGETKFCGSWKLYWPDGTQLPHDQCPRRWHCIRGDRSVAWKLSPNVLTALVFLSFPFRHLSSMRPER